MRYVRQPTDREREELERMLRQEVGRVAMRVQIIMLSVRRYTASQIAEIQQTSDVTVYTWLDRFDEEGPQGLYDRPRSGRPSKIDQEAQKMIETCLTQPPTKQGYNFSHWTIPLLTQHLCEKLEKTLCCETVRQALHRLSFRWRRPRWAVQREDPKAAERMWAIWEAVCHAGPETHIFLQDETILKTLPPLRRMWMRQGEQVRIATPQQNDSTSLYGVLELYSGDSFHAFFETGNSDHTIAYLEQLLAHYSKGPILLIWDQARYHTSQKVQDWLTQHPRLTVKLLPKYAAELNPVESIWRKLKNQVAANLTRSLEAIQIACDRFFQQHSSADLLRFAGLAYS